MAMTLHQSRVNVQMASGLDALAGIWLILAPFALQFTNNGTAAGNSMLFGLAVTILAASREFGQGYKHAWPSWVNAVIGAWLIASPFVLGFSGMGTETRTHILSGAIVVVLALWSALSTPRADVR